MGKTSIEWTGYTWNPIRGTKGRHICQRISPGCQLCYAAKMNVRFSGIDYVAGADVPRLDEEALLLPLRWRKPRTIFVCSMSDLFWEAIPDDVVARVWNRMAGSPTHTFQVLTKRAERMRAFLSACKPDGLGWITHNGSPAIGFGGDGIIVGNDNAWPLPNVWLGVSVEDQQRADERIPLLLQTPAAVRWASYEPALGPVDFRRIGRTMRGDDFDALLGIRTSYQYKPRSSDECGIDVWSRGGEPCLDWIVFGFESGPGARDGDLDWARSVRDQCGAAGRVGHKTAFFLKQTAIRGRKIPTPELDGRRWVEMPEVRT